MLHSTRQARRLLVAAGLLLAGQVHADGAATAQQQCAGCHALVEPDFAALGSAERLERKAPPLYYAGNKYRADWLQHWLQQPERLYPAGYFPNAAVTTTAAGDVIDSAVLAQHPAVDQATAAELRDYLMGLRARDALVADLRYTEGKTALRMATMDFRKFKGCDACHQDAVDSGGASGPVLHNAWQRLQPEYLLSFIQDPQAWDPNSIMPRMQMNEAAVGKLVDYLRLIGGEE